MGAGIAVPACNVFALCDLDCPRPLFQRASVSAMFITL
jgi:hypothetical protein